MASLKNRARRFSGKSLSAVILSVCISACSVTPAPPMPDTSQFFRANVRLSQPPVSKGTCPTAKVPKFARLERIEGWAVAGVDIGPDGIVNKITFHALSDPRFAEAAHACFSATRFHPARRMGQPVTYRNFPMVMHFKVYIP